MSRRGDKPTYTRCVLHGNSAGKRGQSWIMRSKPLPKLPAKFQKSCNLLGHEMKILGDVIVKAGPPKEKKSLKHIEKELRFTIPTVSNNYNIFEQEYCRTHLKLEALVHDIKMQYKAKVFATDVDHVVELEFNDL